MCSLHLESGIHVKRREPRGIEGYIKEEHRYMCQYVV